MKKFFLLILTGTILLTGCMSNNIYKNDPDGDKDTASDLESDGVESDDECVKGCLVDNVCYRDGEVNKDNSCKVCDISKSSDDWSNGEKTDCDDGVFCNGKDSCKNGTCSLHDNNPCDDGDSCNEELTSCCTPKSYEQCGDDNNLYWYDSCNIAGDVKIECKGEHSICTLTGCICEEGWIGEECDRCVIYVDPSKTESVYPKGMSWDNAMDDLQEAIEAAESGKCQIWIAAGTYVPSVPVGGTTDEYTTFSIPEGVELYGGFKGGEKSVDDRNIKSNPTILSGIHATIQSMHVVTLSSDNVLDGLTIRDGLPNGTDSDVFGGGVLISGKSVDEKAIVKISGCIISNNRSIRKGSALYAIYSDLTVIDTEFSSNMTYSATVPSIDGPVYISYSTVKIINSKFADNIADSGGGLYLLYSTGIIENSLFKNNSARYKWGGGLRLFASTVSIINSIFSENKAAKSGAAIDIAYHSNVSIYQSTIFNNTMLAFDDNPSSIYVSSDSQAHFYNSILWNKPGTSAVLKIGDSNTNVTQNNCDISSNVSGITPMINKDPMFENESADMLKLTCTTPQSTVDCSPCVDAGDESFNPADTYDLDSDNDIEEPLPIDIIRNKRVSGQSSDLGAVEFQQ
ncbi:MAG: hypothetical protein JXR91_08465 [Deltaproteobacteria bacterium]|nr:hypothetical protein [Deltaproteobacteria bacterium]